MKVGDLVKVKNPAYLSSADTYDLERAQQLYPWKFELGVITCDQPHGSFPGKEVYVHFPSYPYKTILCNLIEVVNENR